MKDELLLRYSRHILLPQIGAEGQIRLSQATLFILGMGGLGTAAASYLAAAGIGRLILNDDDKVDLTNLPRQLLYRSSAIGLPKVSMAADSLTQINSDCKIDTIAKRLDYEALVQAIEPSDVVLDCSDNFSTRFALNSACYSRKIPLVSGAAIRFEGQVTAFHARTEKSPCYRCLYREEGEEETETCSRNGILGPVVGLVGMIQAIEVLKILLNLGDSLIGRLLLIDAYNMEFRTLKLPRDPHCPVCHK